MNSIDRDMALGKIAGWHNFQEGKGGVVMAVNKRNNCGLSPLPLFSLKEELVTMIISSLNTNKFNEYTEMLKSKTKGRTIITLDDKTEAIIRVHNLWVEPEVETKPMTFEDIWEGLCEQNSKFKTNSVVTMKVSGIRAVLEQAHAEGVRVGEQSVKEDEPIPTKKTQDEIDAELDDLLIKFFGGCHKDPLKTEPNYNEFWDKLMGSILEGGK